ncbi:MAG: PqqD family protein, partial [Desulfosporosinus sp.]
LNEDAADVWQLCNGNRSIHEIISLLENSYEKEELTSRLEELLSFFIDNNILLDASKNRIE